LWGAFDDKMRTAVGDSVRFDAMLLGILAEIGPITETIAESLDRERNMWVYRARCNFGKAETPLVLLLAFTDDGAVSGLAVQPDAPREYPSSKLDYQIRTHLDLPFRGLWYVVWGGRNIEDNHHTVSEAERFAMDVLIAQDGSSHTGDGTNLTDYYCYGREVLAPGPGLVVKVHDNEPDQQPGKRDPQNPLGNAVMIDHGNGEFSLLAHMQPGTIRVKVGDTVETQTVLGLVGNSGNTTEPHIHYHVMDGPDMETAEGLPVRFYSIVVDGEIVSWVEPTRGDFIRRTE
jgi:hypothetical protein